MAYKKIGQKIWHKKNAENILLYIKTYKQIQMSAEICFPTIILPQTYHIFCQRCLSLVIIPFPILFFSTLFPHFFSLTLFSLIYRFSKLFSSHYLEPFPTVNYLLRIISHVFFNQPILFEIPQYCCLARSQLAYTKYWANCRKSWTGKMGSTFFVFLLSSLG